MNKKKIDIKNTATKFFVYICAFLIMLFSLKEIRALMDLVYSDSVNINIWLRTIIMVVIVWFCFMFSIIIHEAGHLVFGLISGYKFCSFRISKFIILKENEKLKFKRIKIAGTGGQCLMCPPQLKDGKMPVVLYNLGGVIFNLIFGFVFLFTYKFIDNPIFSLAFLLSFILNMIFLLSNGIPMRLIVNNDGYNALHLGKDEDAMKALWIQLKVNELQTNGIRLKDMPKELFIMPTDEKMQNSMISTVGVFCANRLIDESNFEEAYNAINHLLSLDNGITPIHKYLLLCDKIYLDLVYRNQKDEIQNLLSNELKNFMKSMKKYPSILRTEYAIALLYENNVEKANNIKKEFDKISKNYPYQIDIDSEKELILLCDQIK